MTTLEQQCEEIRNSRDFRYWLSLPEEKVGFGTPVALMRTLSAYIDELRTELCAIKHSRAQEEQYDHMCHELQQAHAEIAELRRPSDAKEIREILERSDWEFSDPTDSIQRLGHALAESQRDNARYANAHSVLMAERERSLNLHLISEADLRKAEERIVALENKCALHAASEKQLDTQLDLARECAEADSIVIIAMRTRAEAAEQQAAELEGKCERQEMFLGENAVEIGELQSKCERLEKQSDENRASAISRFERIEQLEGALREIASNHLERELMDANHQWCVDLATSAIASADGQNIGDSQS